MGHADTKRQRMENMEDLLLATKEGLTPTEIARKLGCDRTTVHDYLDEMPSVINDGKGRYRLDPAQYINNVRLSSAEALSIYLALRRFIRQTSHAPEFFMTAIRKISRALHHPNLTEAIAESSMQLETDAASIKLYTDVWNTLQRGWLDNVVVRVQYQKNRSEAVDEHEFAPYLFEPAVLSHGVYVIGWSYTRDSLRTFKIDRILKASLTTERFEKSAHVIPDELLAHAWGVWYGDELKKVELLFAPSVARRVQETIWHPSQKTELMEDGSLLWWVEIAGLLELIPWIRGWGHEVEVLLPASLRREIAGSLRQAANIYDKG